MVGELLSPGSWRICTVLLPCVLKGVMRNFIETEKPCMYIFVSVLVFVAAPNYLFIYLF